MCNGSNIPVRNPNLSRFSFSMCDSDNEVMEVEPVPGKRIPWVEKYRPEKVEDVSHQNEVVQTLKSAIDHGGSIPHLMFYGPPGTGDSHL